MKHERGIAGLWAGWIRLYATIMSKEVYNIRLLGDAPLRRKALDQFLDAYAVSIDVFPSTSRSMPPRGADALWSDFVKISRDASKAISKHTPNDRLEADPNNIKRSHLSAIKRLADGGR